MVARTNEDVHELLGNDGQVILSSGEGEQGERKKGSKRTYLIIFTTINRGQTN